ncbi:GNAT family N-acetyltransferase [Bdellovibrio bacteriovorus]|uniref:GNAT family N-acetyltransferase n=1 Tax=Bdellovibrio bacteriovorus TaxID=959 RepID=UPI0035A7406B
MNIQFSTYACATGQAFNVHIEGTTGLLKTDKVHVPFKVSVDGESTTLNTNGAVSAVEILAMLEALFNSNKSLQSVTVTDAHPEIQALVGANTSPLVVNRDDFFQLRPLWVHNGLNTWTPEKWTTTKDVAHPVRPAIQEGQILYRRTLSDGKVLTFRVAHIEKDLDIFHEWHNQPRVLKFWELDKPKEELRDYLAKGLKDGHQFPTILEFDGVPVGYFEMYWTKEDRLGPYYDSEAFDRGFHFLIGDVSVLGFANTDAILKSVCHYLFLEEPRTRKIMAEPRSDNVNVLKYLETFTAWKKLKEFDFPHKRAALLECRREAFFGGRYL